MGKNQFRVDVDEELMDLVPGYLERVQKNLKELKSLAQSGNFEKVRILGHNLKGSGGGYGFDRISEIGALIETAAKGDQRDTVISLCDEMAHYVDNVEINYTK